VGTGVGVARLIMLVGDSTTMELLVFLIVWVLMLLPPEEGFESRMTKARTITTSANNTVRPREVMRYLPMRRPRLLKRLLMRAHFLSFVCGNPGAAEGGLPGASGRISGQGDLFSRRNRHCTL
jgi:hypothetical protein